MHQPPGPPESFIFLAFSYPILRPNLSSFSVIPRGASAPRTTRILHFPCIFLPRTEAQFKLIFCDFARCQCPKDYQNPSSSYGFLAICSPILRFNLSSFTAISRGATTRILHFPCIFLPHTEAQFKFIFCESAPCHFPQDHQNPSFSLHFPTPS